MDEYNNQLKELFEKSTNGILFYDKKGELINANNTALKIMGISKLKSLKGSNIFDNPNIASKKDKLITEGTLKFKYKINFEYIKKIGIYNQNRSGIAFIEYNVSIIESGYMVQIQDITEYKLGEQQNQKNLEELQTLLEELHVSNEELHSTTDELQVANEELKLQEAKLLKANKALKESYNIAEADRNRLNTLIKTIPSAVIIIEQPDGKISFINDHAKKLYGMDPTELKMEEYPQIGLLKLDGSPYAPEEMPASRSLLNGEIVYNEDLILENPDGKRVIVCASLAPIYDSEGEISSVIGIFDDITERKQLENELIQARDYLEEQVKERTEELNSQHQRLFDMLELLPVMICLLTPDYHVAFANRAFRDTFGESEGKHCYEYLFGFNEPCHWCEAYSVLETGKPHYWELETPDDTIIHVHNMPFKDVDGSPLILEMDIDVTEQRKNENALKRSNNILNGINQIFQAGLTVESEEELAQTALNVIEDIIGSSFGFICEINPKNLLNTIAISFSGWEECKIPYNRQLIMATDLPIHGIRGRVIKDAKPLIFNDAEKHPEWVEPPEGHTKIKSFLGVPLIYADNVFGEIGLAHKDKDFTKDDLKTVELISFALVEALTSYRNRNKLKESVSELKRSNNELESFAYITSHDLQEPLRTIASYAQLIERRYKGKLDPDADEFINFMVDGSKRMKEMIQGLLDYSRVGTKGNEFTEFNTQDALDYALSNLMTAINENNAKITHTHLPTIYADKDQIARVFQNLIGNALKFQKEGVKPQIHISAKKEDMEHVFSVSDNGIGIDGQYCDQIFEVFKRLHAIGEYSGAGVGLAIVKRIIDRHGGRIWVESKPSNGSTFYFTIPLICH
ncbi:ATP-binding protein [Methanobacterium sp.]|uniref:ATP-binding protein n=1 Tax=Methanobacterium sp. TaxID=2164 RepID=UPI003C74F758